MAPSTPPPPSPSGESDALIGEILALFGQVAHRFSSVESEEWGWIESHALDPQVVELMQDATAITLRVIDAIGRLEPVNGITIATQFHIPKGTVSKVTRRLLAKNLLSSESLPHNKKEVLFRLTPRGRDIFAVHRAFDEQMERGFTAFLGRYSADELLLLVRILRDATQASFVTLGQRPVSMPE